MKKIVLFIVLLMPILAGCANSNDEQEANESRFNVVFNSIDKEEKTAMFTVNGLPNEEEFTQLETIIIDSMDGQKLESTEYTISVYSQIQAQEDDPSFGTAKFKDGEITDNQLVNISEDDYITLMNK